MNEAETKACPHSKTLDIGLNAEWCKDCGAITRTAIPVRHWILPGREMAGDCKPEAVQNAGTIAGSLQQAGSVPPETRALMWTTTAQKDIEKASANNRETHLHNAKAALWNAMRLLEDALALNDRTHAPRT